MVKRVSLLTISLFALMFFITPLLVIADTSIDQVKQNVKKLRKPIKEKAPHVTAVEFKKIMDSGEKFVLVDVRTKDEFIAAHLPGAIHINRGLTGWTLPKKIQNTDTKIYVYSGTGARSAFTQRLLKMGYTDVTTIYDAFKGWAVAGYPVYNKLGEFTLTAEGFEKKEPGVKE